MSAPAVRLNNDIVAINWIKSIPLVAALATPPPVAATVPAKAETWASTGFYEVPTTGGSPHPDFPYRRPVVTVFCWAVDLGGKKPPWGAAARLAEYLFDACYDETLVKKVLEITAGTEAYPAAQIIEVNCLAEPRKIPGEATGYARYMIDIQLGWVQP